MKNFLLGVMSTVLCIVVLGANYQQQAVKKQEYTNASRHYIRAELPSGPGAEDRLELAFINKQAARGWRLFQVEPIEGGSARLWFERETR